MENSLDNIRILTEDDGPNFNHINQLVQKIININSHNFKVAIYDSYLNLDRVDFSINDSQYSFILNSDGFYLMSHNESAINNLFVNLSLNESDVLLLLNDHFKSIINIYDFAFNFKLETSLLKDFKDIIEYVYNNEDYFFFKKEFKTPYESLDIVCFIGVGFNLETNDFFIKEDYYKGKKYSTKSALNFNDFLEYIKNDFIFKPLEKSENEILKEDSIILKIINYGRIS